MTPEELRRQLEQLKQLRDSFVPAANEAARQSKLGTMNEKYIPNKAGGGQVNQDAMQLALMNKGGGLEKFLKPSVVKERMYHGTSHYASTPEKENKLTSTGIKGFKKKSRGTFLSPDADLAEYTNTKGGVHGAVYPVHVQVQNPFDFDNSEHINALASHTRLEPDAVKHLLFRDTDNWQTLEEPWMQKAIKQLGHDAYYTLENGRKNLAVYDPRKIKSAVGNRGTYDTSKYDITMNKGGHVVNIPLHDIEHGESATPGGKLTWPKAHELIKHYASLKTDVPPIDVMSPDEPHGKWMIADGSHRYEAAKLRGMTHIKAKISPHDKEGLEYSKKYKANGGITHAHHLEIEERPL